MKVKKDLFDPSLSSSVWLFTIENSNQNIIELTNFGGIVHSWTCPDKSGVLNDILLGCPNYATYLAGHPYFGCIVGRYANRISKGHFAINEVDYNLAKNLGKHHLHGGRNGFDKKIWDFEVVEKKDEISIILKSESLHLEEGYPGNLKLKVIYSFNENNELSIEYFAKTDRDTHINLTNHCYFNLSGDPKTTILDHLIQINSKNVTETDSELIPTGRILKTKNTILDFNTVKQIGDKMLLDDSLLIYSKGFDHNYILEKHHFDEAMATVLQVDSGRRLMVYTDQPALQFYTGNWLDKVVGKNGLYQDYSGFCLETQHYPDTPNHEYFPSTLLKSGENYYSKTIYKVDLK